MTMNRSSLGVCCTSLQLPAELALPLSTLISARFFTMLFYSMQEDVGTSP